MIRLHFTRGKGIVPALIRWITASEINHVAIEVDGRVWQVAHDEVVNQRDLRVWLQLYDDTYHSSHILYGLDEIEVRDRLVEQEGKKYDWLALLCWPMYCHLHTKNRWLCSELIGDAIRELITHTRFHSVSPRHLKAVGHAVETGYRIGVQEALAKNDD